MENSRKHGASKKFESGGHGGARKGAGRKPAEVKKVNLTVSVSPEAKARIEAKARKNGVSASALVDGWGKRLKD